MKDVSKVAEAVGAVTKAMHSEATVVPKKLGYVRKCTDRKLMLLVLAAGSTDRGGWSTATAKSLTSLLPDQHEFTSGIPEQWSAAEMSNFLFGREDWAVFASMWACLWNEVHDKHEDDERRQLIHSFLDGGTSSPFAERARAMASEKGHNGTPCMVVDELLGA